MKVKILNFCDCCVRKCAWQGQGQVTVLNPGSFIGRLPILKTIPAEEHAGKKFQLHSLLYWQPVVGSLECGCTKPEFPHVAFPTHMQI